MEYMIWAILLTEINSEPQFQVTGPYKFFTPCITFQGAFNKFRYE